MMSKSNKDTPLDRFYSHYNNREPIVFMAVDSPDNTPEQNQENLEALARHLSLAGFLYHKVMGEYTARDKQVQDDVHTVIIYAYPDRQDELKRFAISLGKAFKQAAILLISRGGTATLISPEKLSERDIGRFQMEHLNQYFNRIGKRKYRINALSEPKNYPDRPLSMEMPAFESYRKKLAQSEDIFAEWEKNTSKLDDREIEEALKYVAELEKK